jgi:hypothetical protein
MLVDILVYPPRTSYYNFKLSFTDAILLKNELYWQL